MAFIIPNELIEKGAYLIHGRPKSKSVGGFADDAFHLFALLEGVY